MDPKNLEKLKGFLRFLQMQLFGSLESVMAVLDPYWPFLARYGPKMGPKMAPTVVQKVFKNWSNK
jgi:hypothetical protein